MSSNSIKPVIFTVSDQICLCRKDKKPLENRLAYLTREAQPLTRRAILIWWIKVCHVYPLLSIRKNRGGIQCHTRVGLFFPSREWWHLENRL
jgi:hypothetical protein